MIGTSQDRVPASHCARSFSDVVHCEWQQGAHWANEHHPSPAGQLQSLPASIVAEAGVASASATRAGGELHTNQPTTKTSSRAVLTQPNT